MMVTYPPFMQRHPHFAAGAVAGSFPGAQAFPAFPQFSTATLTSPPMPIAAFALQAQIPSPVRLSPPTHRPEPADKTESKKKTDSAQQQAGASPKCSFSIESILSKDEDKCSKTKDSRSREHQQQAAAQTAAASLSPATPISAGPASAKPNGFYYFYPPQAAQGFPFAAPGSCLESELHRSAALHGRLSAPVAVISEIVRNAAGTNSFSIVCMC